MKPRYNHLYGLGFSVDSDDPHGTSAEEIMAALWMRMAELRSTGEVLEAVGVPEETLDNRTGWTVELDSVAARRRPAGPGPKRRLPRRRRKGRRGAGGAAAR